MSHETLVRQFYTVFNTGDVHLLDQILAADWVEYPLSALDQAPGREEFKPIVRSFRTTFPDVQFINEDIIVADEKITVRSSVTATHSASFLGVEPTGRKVKFSTIDIHRIENEAIVETWHIEDLLSVLQQISAPENLHQ